MKSKLSILIILIACIVSHSQALDKSITMSKEVLEYIQQGKSIKVVPHFDETMKKSLPPEKLDEAWTGLSKQLGGFLSNGDVTTDNIQGYKVVYIICLFKNDKLKFKAVFNSENKISGLFFVPANQK